MAGYVFNDNDRREINRLKRKVDSIRGPGVTNTPDSIYIYQNSKPGRGGAPEPIAQEAVGEFQHQNNKMLSTNQRGWGFQTAHGLP